MSLLGIDVRFLTAFGDDDYARRIEASCAGLGIDVSNARKVAGARTGTYLYLEGPDGDMALAVNDMAICEQITPQYLSRNLTILNNAQVVVVDANIPEESIRYLCEHCTSPIFCDPVSVAKAGKVKPYIGMMNTLKPNRMEAELIAGIKINNEEDLKKAAEIMLEETEHMIRSTRNLFYALAVHGKMKNEGVDTAALTFALTVHSLIDYQLDKMTAGKAEQLRDSDTLYTKELMEFVRWFSVQVGGEEHE